MGKSEPPSSYSDILVKSLLVKIMIAQIPDHWLKKLRKAHTQAAFRYCRPQTASLNGIEAASVFVVFFKKK